MENVVSILSVMQSPWPVVLERIRMGCNDFGLAFFDAVGYEGFFDGYACLTVPDKFRETWLNSHYGSLLRKTFSEVIGSDFIDYRVRLLSPSEEVPEIKLTPSRPVRPAAVKAPVKKARARLPLYPNYTFDNFIEGSCNSMALRACESVVEEPYDPGMNPLLVYGASGLGKTHLLHSVAAKLQTTNPDYKIVYRQAYDFLRDSAAIGEAMSQRDWNKVQSLKDAFRENYAECDVLLIDDIQLLEKALKSQERLAALIKILRNEGKRVILTCDRHPSSFKKLADGEAPAKDSKIPQLSSNLLAHLENCMAVGLAEPDFNTRMNLIRKKSEDIPFASDDREEICRFLSIPPRANIRIIEGLLNWLRAMHSLNGVELDLNCVKRLIAPKNDASTVPTIKSITETVAASFHVDVVALSSKRQDQGASIPRKIAMFLCRELTSESLQNVGANFKRDYATVIAAIQSLTRQMDEDDVLARRVKDIRYMLEN